MKHTVKEHTLKNGLKGLVLRVPEAPVISIEFSFRAGEFLLDRNKWETAHVMEHLMLGANGSFKTARAFQAELEKNGAYSNASTSAYDVNYEVECAAFEADRVIKLLIGAIESPIFKPSEFKAEFGNVSEELVGRSNNHFRTLNLALRTALGFYSVPDQERVELMKNVSLEDVKEHYAQTHSISNARFVIAGDVKPSHIKLLESMKLPGTTERISLPDEKPKVLNTPVIILRKDVPNIYFYIDSYAPRLLNQTEKDALSVASTLLTETLHSKLLGAAREKGLVYAMGSGQQQIKGYSSFWLGAQVSKKNAVKLFDLTRDVFQGMKQGGITAEELDSAKQYMKGRHARSAQTVTGLLGKYSHEYYQTDEYIDEASFQSRIESITAKDVCDVLNLTCSGEWAFGLLGDISDTTSSLLYDKVVSVLH